VHKVLCQNDRDRSTKAALFFHLLISRLTAGVPDQIANDVSVASETIVKAGKRQTQREVRDAAAVAERRSALDRCPWDIKDYVVRHVRLRCLRLEPETALLLEKTDLVNEVVADVRKARLVTPATVPVIGPPPSSDCVYNSMCQMQSDETAAREQR
jgi:hypothetical protein